MPQLVGLVHVLHTIALALWVGGLVVLVRVLGTRGRVRPDAVLLLEAARRRGRMLVFWSVVALILTLAAEILAQAAIRAGGSGAFAPALRAVLFGSRYGVASLARWLILVAALFAVDELGRTPAEAPARAAQPGRHALGIVARPPRPAPPRISRRAWLRLSALLAAALVVCTALAGPYGTTPGATIVDALHLGAAALWLGGTAALAVVVGPALALVAPERRPLTLLTLLDRFTSVAALAALVLALTSLWEGSHRAAGATALAVPAILSGPLRVLTLLLLVALGGGSALVLRPRLRRLSTRRGAALAAGAIASRLCLVVRVLWLDGALALVALLLGAVGDPTPRLTAAATVAGPPATAVHAGALALTLHVAPAATGANTYTVRLWHGGHPLAGAHVMVVAQSLAMHGIDPPAAPATDLGDGRYQARGVLTAGGRWRLRVLIRGGASAASTAFVVDAGAIRRTGVAAACTRLAPGRAGVWQPLGPKLITHSLIADPADHAILYAGTIGGVYRSTDGGKCWAPASTGLYNSSLEVWSLTLLPDGSLMAATGAGIYRSTDHAAHWRLAGLPTRSIYTLAAHLAGHTVLLAGGDGGIFRSDDAAAHWRVVYRTSAAAVTSLAWPSIRPSYAIAGISPAGQPIAVSHDGGLIWQREGKGLPGGPGMLSVAVAPGARDVYAGSMGLGLYASPGISGVWQGRNSGLPGLRSGDVHVGSFAFDHDAPATLYIATDYGVYRSVDAGGRWAPFGRGLRGDATVVTTLTLVTGAHPVLYACTAAGLYRQPLPAPT